MARRERCAATTAAVEAATVSCPRHDVEDGLHRRRSARHERKSNGVALRAPGRRGRGAPRPLEHATVSSPALAVAKTEGRTRPATNTGRRGQMLARAALATVATRSLRREKNALAILRRSRGRPIGASCRQPSRECDRRGPRSQRSELMTRLRREGAPQPRGSARDGAARAEYTPGVGWATMRPTSSSTREEPAR